MKTDLATVKQELAVKLTAAYNEFIDALNNIPEGQINNSPFEGSWTPGEVASHIIKATKAIPDKNAVDSERNYDEKIHHIDAVFANPDTKMKSPGYVYPDSGPFNKKDLIDQLATIRDKYQQRISERDITHLCIGFELPPVGTMTRYEWFWFNLTHVKRHLYQLKNMAVALEDAG